MASKQLTMKGIVSVVVAILVAVCEGQQLHVKHVPSYVVLQSQEGDSALPSSDLHNVLAGPLGLSNKKSPAMQTKSLLKRPKANVLITVATHKEQSLPVNSMASFALDWDVPYVKTELLMNRVQRKFLDQDPLMLELASANQAFDIKTSSSLFQSLPSSFASLQDRLLDADSFLNRLSPGSSFSSSLNSSLTSDGGLLAELQMVDDVVATLKKNVASLNGKTPDLFSFTLTGLKAIGDEHGVNSDQAKDAEKLLTNHLDQITEDLKSIYKDNVMVEVLTVPSLGQANVRKTRSLMETLANSKYGNLNLEIDYYADFPVTFNIVLWMMVVLFIAVFLVAYGIWNMNPNLESILYRVPQDEIKKNN
ncbi:renin receptor [Aplysia californica]|uniref:Renin receptor n=1 Tax=Aplysia californica TaxID=6500 RepID=A0ABM0K1T7_APLCA|nr:renin receptor [Aplysia californica]